MLKTLQLEMIKPPTHLGCSSTHTTMVRGSSSQEIGQSAPVHSETSEGDNQASTSLAISRSALELSTANPPAYGPSEREGSAVTRPTSALQLQDACPFAFYVPTPTATTATTAASSALPLTPPSAFRPSRSRIHSRSTPLPAHAEGEDRPSTMQFAFRPPSEPAPPQSSGSQTESEFLHSESGGSTAASVPHSSSAKNANADVISRSQSWPSSLEKKGVTLSTLPATPPEKYVLDGLLGSSKAGFPS